jgi:beta-alanine degradation protein BauB
MHSHSAVVVYSLSTSKFKSTTSDGQTTEDQAKPGTAVWRDAVTHSWECLGPDEHRAIVTALKGRVKPREHDRTHEASSPSALVRL